MNPHIYLHEIVRTVPGREEPYLASVLSLHHEPSRRGRGRPAFGQFRSLPVSGAWPSGINIWENSWAGQTEDLVSQFEDTARDTVMEDWWNRNLHLRRGGYDRLLVPARYSPTLDQLLERGVRGVVFLHEILWLPFGAPAPYLDALEQALASLASLGLDLVGAFRVALRPRQVLTILAARDWAAVGAFAGSDAAELARWRELRAGAASCEELLLLPARHSPLAAAPP